MKLSKAIEEFLKEEQVRGNTEATIDHYRKQLKCFLKFYKDKDIKDINYDIYEDYILYLKDKNKESSGFENKKVKLSSRTIKTYASALKTFIIYLYNKNYIKQDIGSDIKMPRYNKKLIEILTETQVKELISLYSRDTFIDCRDYLIITLMLDARIKTFRSSFVRFNRF